MILIKIYLWTKFSTFSGSSVSKDTGAPQAKGTTGANGGGVQERAAATDAEEQRFTNITIDLIQLKMAMDLHSNNKCFIFFLLYKC